MNRHVPTKSTRTYRGRSRAGCAECRKRHVKCDEQKPICGRCSSAGRACSGSLATLLAYSPPKPSSKPTTVTKELVRRPPIAALTRSLEDPLSDPNGIFKAIGAPQMPNLESLAYWISIKTSASPQGWAGSLTPLWVSMLPKYSQKDPAVAILTSYFALKIQKGLSGIDNSTQQARAQLAALKEMQKYKTVTGPMLLSIAGMASSALEDGDVPRSETHLKAIRTLFREDMNIDMFEWIVVWGSDLQTAAMLGRRLFLPEYVPPSLKQTEFLSADEISNAHRKSAENAVQMFKLVQNEYLEILAIFEELHVSYTAVREDSHPGDDLPLYARGIIASRRINEFSMKCKELESKDARHHSESSYSLFRRLLALVMQSCNWRFYTGTVARTKDNEEELDLNNIQVMYLDQINAITQKFKDIQAMMTAWKKFASLESLCWIASLLIGRSHRYRQTKHLRWVKLLQIITTSPSSGITSDDLRTRLKQWPIEPTDIDIVVDKLQENDED